MFNPVSTYRIQFHKGFNFHALERIIPYLLQLGIKTVYASPIFKSPPGSIHGYDITDPHTINPEIGTLEQLYHISNVLKKAGISWLQDIVPNHMAIHEDNAWLMDVLKNGQNSSYASYFDIDWEHPAFAGKLMLPLLATSTNDAIEQRSIQLTHVNGHTRLQYNGTLLPISEATHKLIKDKSLDEINRNTKLLSAVLQQQHYVLCHHADANKQINYRRFFTINNLISLNIQREEVFNDYHTLIQQLCTDGIFQGLRIDHIDGLYNPTQYLYRLRKLVGKNVLITVEKILQRYEKLPSAWPVAGATGYEFLAIVNNLFTNAGSKEVLTKHYKSITGEKENLANAARSKKLLILRDYMNGDLENLCRIAAELASTNETITHGDLKAAISEFLALCPVYRYYGSLPLADAEEKEIDGILLFMARNKNPAESPKLLRRLLLDKPAEGDSEYNKRATHFFRRCMQVAGPLMAKGIEDTLMYTWNCLIGHNEVGDQPGSWGCDAKYFHAFMQERQQQWPLALNATATHDTKRGEDARARLNILTELPEEWLQYVKLWHNLPKDHLYSISPNDEYLVYQALVAAWPSMPGDSTNFKSRFNEYIIKALREAKTHTNWHSPNEEYERDVISFAEWLQNSEEFKKPLSELLAAINDGSTIVSLCQVVLKMMCPGVPDIYQGNELYDYNMVDPDNRRPIDYDMRLNLLKDIPEQTPASWWRTLWRNRLDGHIKLALTTLLLKERSAAHSVFSDGDYLPLTVKGKYRKHLLAFARQYRQVTYAIIVPLNVLKIAREQTTGIADIDWKDTTVILPETHNNKWQHVLTKENVLISTACSVQSIFGVLPLAILKSTHHSSKRCSGILLPLFSLNSQYGIGDFGHGAYKFIDFLKNSYQKYWQLLPLNPTVAGESHSPYSCISGMAMNTLFIAPDILAEHGLLTNDELRKWHLPPSATIHYEQCRHAKEEMQQIAWNRFKAGSFEKMRYEFDEFCNEHAHWLTDFALYVSIKHTHNYEPWYHWPAPYRTRQQDTLDLFAAEHTEEIMKIKWLQYLAGMQWGLVKHYAKVKGISLFGDMPFYMSYDSVDVWARPELFCLDAEGRMTGVAGVPPDYFSETGQLWNMPTYNWGALKETDYKWWIDRLRRNLEMFDLLRIDHFRAFEAYWQVEAGQETAELGMWKKGPGLHFFNIAREQLGHLPFIAEDLGNEMEKVYHLRDKTGLPGMKVLQFAWGENIATSVDAPHNYTENCIVYTGTHDNHTTRGWWTEEAKKEDKKRIAEYTGQKINAANAHTSLLRIAYASVAKLAIIPIQDILGLDGNARINTPGTNTGNWVFRLSPDALKPKIEKMLRHLTLMYNRYRVK